MWFTSLTVMISVELPTLRFVRLPPRITASYLLDDDFLTLSDERHDVVLFVPDTDIPPERVADAVDEISEQMSEDKIGSVVYVTDGWL